MSLKGKLSDKSIILKLLVWLSFLFLLTVICVSGWSAATGGHPSTTSLKVLQMLQTLCVFIIPSLAAVWLWSERPLHWLHLDKGLSATTFFSVILMMIVFSPGINLLATINQKVELPAFLSGLEQMLQEQEQAAAELTELFAQADTLLQLLFNLFIMALLPAIGEEICFRGTCQGLFVQGTDGLRANAHGQMRLSGRTHLAIWVTAIIFSSIHFQFYGFIPRMLLGAMLGYLLCWSGSLYVPMLAHFTNNAIAVISYYMAGKGFISDEAIDSFGTGDTLWVGLLSLIAGATLLYFIRRQYANADKI